MSSSILTIIIPTYNSENYIDILLKSLCKQTYNNFNIIIIDDNSNDNTLTIIDKYVKLFNKLNIYSLNKNYGPSYCRNFGLFKVTTPYVTFSDSDDWIDSTIYENSLQFMKKNIDIINYGIKYEYPTKRITDKKYSYKKNHILSGSEALSIYGHTSTNKIKIAPIVNNKIYKTEYLKNNGIIFNESIRYQEDDVFTFKALLSANKVAFIPNCFYHYVQREQSLIHQVSKTSVTHFVQSYTELINYLKNHNLFENYEKEFFLKFTNSMKSVVERIKNYSKNTMQKIELLLLLSEQIKINLNSEETLNLLDKLIQN